jgi:Na+-transporting NADH:ubiquinone oxidoreductase subunit A
LIRTRKGAFIDDLIHNELLPGEHRVISGSVFSGHTAEKETAFLGRYHQQITVIPVEKKESFMGWLYPGFRLYSLTNTFISKFIPRTRYRFSTCLHGGVRAIVPIESYEKVMPLDLLPTYLLRALAVQDIDEAENLGCLELVEEDLALCSFVCPSKIDHGRNLRKTLDLIEKEG